MNAAKLDERECCQHCGEPLPFAVQLGRDGVAAGVAALRANVYPPFNLMVACGHCHAWTLLPLSPLGRWKRQPKDIGGREG